MKTLKELYRIGTGPSSSHTMAPRKAAEQFLQRHPDAAKYQVTLYGSLAATGRGHLTDVVIGEVFQPAPLKIIWAPEEELPLHPNAMLFEALTAEAGPPHAVRRTRLSPTQLPAQGALEQPSP